MQRERLAEIGVEREDSGMTPKLCLVILFTTWGLRRDLGWMNNQKRKEDIGIFC